MKTITTINKVTLVILSLLPAINAGGSNPSSLPIHKPPHPLNFEVTTAEQRAAFEQDGYIVIRGLLSDESVKELMSASDEEYQNGMAGSKNFNGNVQSTRIALSPGPFQNAALYSNIPKVAAELMQLNPQSQNLRMIHDFFLSRNINDIVKCDWHVDGHGLWPESYETPSPASKASGKDQDGVNAWIALDDMSAEHEGSMALAAGSHKVPWRYDAYRAIGRDGTKNGGETWQEFVDRAVSGKGMVNHPEQGNRIRLCSLGVTAPDLCEKMEAQKHVLDLKAGDVVFATRNLFHRTLDVTNLGREHFENLNKTNLHRYTIRYTTGSAQLPTGYCWLEWSILCNPEIAGWTLDEAMEPNQNIPHWFPEVWPEGPNKEGLRKLDPHVEVAKKKYQEAQTKLMESIAASKEAEAAGASEKGNEL